MSSIRGRLPGASATSSRSAPNARPMPDDAAEQAEDDAFEQQLAREPPGARAKRRANRQLLLPRVGPHEQQVGHVGARDEQDHADGRHQHPQRLLDVADQLVLHRSDHRRDARLFEDLHVAAGKWREPAQRDRNHARRIGVRLIRCVVPGFNRAMPL